MALPDSPSAALAGMPQQTYWDFVTSVIPDNILAPFLSANVLSVLLIAAAVGIAIAKLPIDSREQEVLIAFFSGVQKVLFTIVSLGSRSSRSASSPSFRSSSPR